MMLIISNKNFFIKNLDYKRTVIYVFFNSYYFVNFIKIQEFFDGAAPAQ